MPTARTIETETAAAVMRLTRRQYAQRIREARRAAAHGHPNAQIRVQDLRVCPGIPPNPDRQAICLTYAARTAEALKQLEVCRHDPDLDGIAALIERTRQRGEVLQGLADTAVSPSGPRPAAPGKGRGSRPLFWEGGAAAVLVPFGCRLTDTTPPPRRGRGA